MNAQTDPAGNAEGPKGTVFISYSKEDVAWRQRVQAFLETLETWGGAEVWADDRIDAGERWFSEIKDAIGRSAVAVLLLTKDFLRTDFIAKEEVPELLRRREELGMKLIPLLIHDCPWKAVHWLRALNIVPGKATPLDTMGEQEQDRFLARMTEDIAEFLETWEEPTGAPAAEAPVTATIDVSHLPETSATLFGRDEELDALDADWESTETRVVAFVAPGGVGKSALINRWIRNLRVDDWRGAERVFGWSFYSQGARDQAATAEMFIDTALRFFGDPDPTQGSAWDRGERLAGLVAAQRTLLVLDGMEPLQSAQDFERGCLRDLGLQALLRRLTRDFRGLCLISTREPVPELAGRDGSRTVDLSTMTPQDGRALLRSLRVVGADAELEALAEEFGPRALCVEFLGAWLYEQPGHTAGASISLPRGPDALVRVLAGFEALLGEGPALDLLRIQGLFDRPAPTAQVAAALGVAAVDPEAVERLRGVRLLAPYRRHRPKVLEAHPLIREHYAEQLRYYLPDRFREGHRRVYQHLCETTERRPDTLEGLAPLYQAVAHGCQAGLHQQACFAVYVDRILRGVGSDGFYSSRKLGANGANLGAVACFFDHPWRRLSPGFSALHQASLLNEAAFYLRALGRLAEAVEPMRAALEMLVAHGDWKLAAGTAVNLGELELTLGEVAAVAADAGQSVLLADHSGDEFQRMASRTSRGDAVHQAGRRDEARRLFAEAEAMQALRQPGFSRLYSVQGFQYCDLLLSEAEHAAWRATLGSGGSTPLSIASHAEPGSASGPAGLEARERASGVTATALRSCYEVAGRATETLAIAEQNDLGLLAHALDHLTLGRAALYQALLTPGIPNLTGADPFGKSEIETHLADAVHGLHNAAQMQFLPLGLLTGAWHRHLTGDASAAAADLDEAWEIAERGPMPLYQADVLLTRARLFGLKIGDCQLKIEDGGTQSDVRGYLWGSPEEDLAEARRLIEKHGYHRRDEELADAEAALVAVGKRAGANEG